MAETYIGVKVIQAEPQEKDGQEGYKVTYEDGYVSWSPKNAFERAYWKVPDGEAETILEDIFSKYRRSERPEKVEHIRQVYTPEEQPKDMQQPPEDNTGE